MWVMGANRKKLEITLGLLTACAMLWGCNHDAREARSAGIGGDDGGDGIGDWGIDGDDDGERFDLAGGGSGGGRDDGVVEESCTGVDLLFVIDNSLSMEPHQTALSLAFPQFADTLIGALPNQTSLRVGVTSTEMGYSASGNTQIGNGSCVFTGENGKAYEEFYVTPDVSNSGRNGAQGRLYKPNGTGAPFVAFDTDNSSGVAAAKSWFTQAAALGTDGSNIEMLTAPAGWAAHPTNTGPGGPNAGFFRDDGVVTVVFFVTDEPDQTPPQIDGMDAGIRTLEMLAESKSQCGGANCIIVGGFMADPVCGTRPIDSFMSALPDPANVAPLPDSALPAETAAAEMNQHLSVVMADVIARKCNDITPAG